MLNLNQRYTELMTELENHIENKQDLEYIKNTFSSFFLKFLEDIEEVTNRNEEKLRELEEKQKEMSQTSNRIEDTIKKIEKDIYINDNYDFEIVCPYCNCEFETEFDELQKEIKCPECHNVIELDWNEEEGCTGDCSCCHGEPEQDESDIDDDM